MSQALIEHQLELANYLAWLEGMEPTAIVGTGGDPYYCPIAEYLLAMNPQARSGKPGVSVSSSGAMILTPSGNVNIPFEGPLRWVWFAIREMDSRNTGRDISAAMAFDILSECEGEAEL